MQPPMLSSRPRKRQNRNRPIGTGSVEIKIEELAARIAGYNLAIRAIGDGIGREGRLDRGTVGSRWQAA